MTIQPLKAFFNKHKNYIFWGFFFLSSVQFVYSITKILKSNIFLPDFVNFYYNNGINIQKGINPYNSSALTPYPPVAFFLFYLFSLFPLVTVQYLWTFSSICSLILAIWITIKTINKKPSPAEFAFLIGLALLSFPVKFTLGMGQINHFLLLFISLAFYFYKKGSTFLSVLFLSLSLHLKLTPIFTLLIFIKNKNWKYLLQLFLAGVVGLTASFIFLPQRIVQEFFFKILPNFRVSLNNATYYNQALTGLLARTIGEQPLIYTLVSLFLIFLSYYHFKKNKKALNFSLAVCLSVLFAPYSWQHHLVFLFLPIIVLYFHLINRQKMILLLTAYLLISINLRELQFLNNLPYSWIVKSHGTLGILLTYFLMFTDKYTLKIKNLSETSD
jgi:hypothetical protein